MSVKIRLSRGGTKKRPYYYIVVAESTSPRRRSASFPMMLSSRQRWHGLSVLTCSYRTRSSPKSETET